jgi:hypothetical protein
MRRALSIRQRTQAHRRIRSQSGKHPMFGSIIRNSPVHVLPSLAATCQSCPVSRKTGRSHYIGSDVPCHTFIATVRKLTYSRRRLESRIGLNAANSGRSRIPYSWYIFANFPMAAYPDLGLGSTAVFLGFLCFLLNRRISRTLSPMRLVVRSASVHNGSPLCITDRTSLLNIQLYVK